MKADGIASRKKTSFEVLRMTMAHDTVRGCFPVKKPFALVSSKFEEKS